MTLSRRSFLGGILGLAGASMVVSSSRALFRPNIPVLIGDGIHDDAPALQALIDGLPVDIRRDGVNVSGSRWASLTGGDFNLSRGLMVRNGFHLQMEGTTLRASPDMDGAVMTFMDDSLIFVPQGGMVHLRGNGRSGGIAFRFG